MYKFICANITKSRSFTSSCKKLVQSKTIHQDSSKPETAQAKKCLEKKEYDEEESGREESPRPSTSPSRMERLPFASNLPAFTAVHTEPQVKAKECRKYYTDGFLIVGQSTPNVSKKYYHLYSINPITKRSSSYSNNYYKKFLNEEAKENYKSAMYNVIEIQKKKPDYQFKTMNIPGNTASAAGAAWKKKFNKKKSSKLEICFPTHTIKHNLTLTKRYKIREGSAEREIRELEDKFKLKKKLQLQAFKTTNTKKITYPTLIENIKKGKFNTVSRQSDNKSDIIVSANKIEPLIEHIEDKKAGHLQAVSAELDKCKELDSIEKDFELLMKSHPTIENAGKDVKMKMKTKFIQLMRKSSNKPTENATSAESKVQEIEENTIHKDQTVYEEVAHQNDNKPEDSQAIISHPQTVSHQNTKENDSKRLRYPKIVLLEPNNTYDVDKVCIKETATKVGSGLISRDYAKEKPKPNYAKIAQEAQEFSKFVKRFKQLQIRSDQTIHTMKKNNEPPEAVAVKLDELKKEHLKMKMELEELDAKFLTDENKAGNYKPDFKKHQSSEKVRQILTGQIGGGNGSKQPLIQKQEIGEETNRPEKMSTSKQEEKTIMDDLWKVYKRHEPKSVSTKKENEEETVKNYSETHMLKKSSKRPLDEKVPESSTSSPQQKETSDDIWDPKALLHTFKPEHFSEKAGRLDASSKVDQCGEDVLLHRIKMREAGQRWREEQRGQTKFSEILSKIGKAVDRFDENTAIGKKIKKGTEHIAPEETSIKKGTNLQRKKPIAKKEETKQTRLEEPSKCEELNKTAEILTKKKKKPSPKGYVLDQPLPKTNSKKSPRYIRQRKSQETDFRDEQDKKIKKDLDQFYWKKKKEWGQVIPEGGRVGNDLKRRKDKNVKANSDKFRRNKNRESKHLTMQEGKQQANVPVKYIQEDKAVLLFRRQEDGSERQKKRDESKIFVREKNFDGKVKAEDVKEEHYGFALYPSARKGEIGGDENPGKARVTTQYEKRETPNSAKRAQMGFDQEKEKEHLTNTSDITRASDTKKAEHLNETVSLKSSNVLDEDKHKQSEKPSESVEKTKVGIQYQQDEAEASKDHKEQILKQFLGSTILPGRQQSIYMPKETLIVNDIKEVDEKNNLCEETKQNGREVSDSALLSPGDEIVILEKNHIAKTYDCQWDLVTQEEKVETALLNTDHLDNGLSLEGALAVSGDRAINDTRCKIDEIIEQIKHLETLIKTQQLSACQGKKSENKPRIAPPKPPTGKEKTDIKKDKPKSPKDMILPPKIRGSNPEKRANEQKEFDRKVSVKASERIKGEQPGESQNVAISDRQASKLVFCPNNEGKSTPQKGDITTILVDMPVKVNDQITSFKQDEIKSKELNANLSKHIEVREASDKELNDKIRKYFATKFGVVNKPIPTEKAAIEKTDDSKNSELKENDNSGKTLHQPKKTTHQQDIKNQKIVKAFYNRPVSCPPDSSRLQKPLQTNRPMRSSSNEKSSPRAAKIGIRETKTKYSSWSMHGKSGHQITHASEKLSVFKQIPSKEKNGLHLPNRSASNASTACAPSKKPKIIMNISHLKQERLKAKSGSSRKDQECNKENSSEKLAGNPVCHDVDQNKPPYYKVLSSGQPSHLPDENREPEKTPLKALPTSSFTYQNIVDKEMPPVESYQASLLSNSQKKSGSEPSGIESRRASHGKLVSESRHKALASADKNCNQKEFDNTTLVCHNKSKLKQNSEIIRENNNLDLKPFSAKNKEKDLPKLRDQQPRVDKKTVVMSEAFPKSTSGCCNTEQNISENSRHNQQMLKSSNQVPGASSGEGKGYKNVDSSKTRGSSALKRSRKLANSCSADHNLEQDKPVGVLHVQLPKQDFPKRYRPSPSPEKKIQLGGYSNEINVLKEKISQTITNTEINTGIPTIPTTITKLSDRDFVGPRKSIDQLTGEIKKDIEEKAKERIVDDNISITSQSQDIRDAIDRNETLKHGDQISYQVRDKVEAPQKIIKRRIRKSEQIENAEDLVLKIQKMADSNQHNAVNSFPNTKSKLVAKVEEILTKPLRANKTEGTQEHKSAIKLDTYDTAGDSLSFIFKSNVVPKAKIETIYDKDSSQMIRDNQKLKKSKMFLIKNDVKPKKWKSLYGNLGAANFQKIKDDFFEHGPQEEFISPQLTVTSNTISKIKESLKEVTVNKKQEPPKSAKRSETLTNKPEFVVTSSKAAGNLEDPPQTASPVQAEQYDIMLLNQKYSEMLKKIERQISAKHKRLQHKTLQIRRVSSTLDSVSKSSSMPSVGQSENRSKYSLEKKQNVEELAKQPIDTLTKRGGGQIPPNYITFLNKVTKHNKTNMKIDNKSLKKAVESGTNKNKSRITVKRKNGIVSTPDLLTISKETNKVNEYPQKSTTENPITETELSIHPFKDIPYYDTVKSDCIENLERDAEKIKETSNNLYTLNIPSAKESKHKEVIINRSKGSLYTLDEPKLDDPVICEANNETPIEKPACKLRPQSKQIPNVIEKSKIPTRLQTDKHFNETKAIESSSTAETNDKSNPMFTTNKPLVKLITKENLTSEINVAHQKKTESTPEKIFLNIKKINHANREFKTNKFFLTTSETEHCIETSTRENVPTKLQNNYVIQGKIGQDGQIIREPQIQEQLAEKPINVHQYPISEATIIETSKEKLPPKEAELLPKSKEDTDNCALAKVYEEKQRMMQELLETVNKSQTELNIKLHERRTKKYVVDKMNIAANHILRKQEVEKSEETFTGNRRHQRFQSDAKFERPSTGSGPWGNKFKKDTSTNNDEKKNIHNATNITDTLNKGKLISKSEFLRIKERQLPAGSKQLQELPKSLTTNLDEKDAEEIKPDFRNIGEKIQNYLEQTSTYQAKSRAGLAQKGKEKMQLPEKSLKLKERQTFIETESKPDLYERIGQEIESNIKGRPDLPTPKLNSEMLNFKVTKMAQLIANELTINEKAKAGFLHESAVHEVDKNDEQKRTDIASTFLLEDTSLFDARKPEIEKMIALKNKNKTARQIEQKKDVKQTDFKVVKDTVILDKEESGTDITKGPNFIFKPKNQQPEPRTKCSELHQQREDIMAESYCKKLILPTKSPKLLHRALLEPNQSTLDKLPGDDVKTVPKEILKLNENVAKKSDPLAKYRHLKITYMNVTRPEESNNKGFLPPTVWKIDDKEVSEDQKNKIINCRFELLKRLKEQFQQSTPVISPRKPDFPTRLSETGGSELKDAKTTFKKEYTNSNKNDSSMHIAKFLDVTKPVLKETFVNEGKIVAKQKDNERETVKKPTQHICGPSNSNGNHKNGGGSGRCYSTDSNKCEGSDSQDNSPPDIKQDKVDECETICKCVNKTTSAVSEDTGNQVGAGADSIEDFDITKAIPDAFECASPQLAEERQNELYYRYYKFTFLNLHQYLERQRVFTIDAAEKQRQEECRKKEADERCENEVKKTTSDENDECK